MAFVKSAEPPHHQDPLIGTQVSEYVIQERIGTGGMGIVYRAVQPLIGKQVAIKVMRAQFAQAHQLVQRLLVEARIVNAIPHRGIIDIFGFGQLEDGRPYVVMELLQGLSLDRLLRRKGRLGVDEAVKILDEVLDALGAAHRRGVVHRDLKPGNVFLVEGAAGARSLKLLDFGIAKVASTPAANALTVHGLLLGTPEYMSPEQVRGGEVEPTSDLYAVGVMAFEMLTGQVPFGGEQVRVLFAQVEDAPPSLSSLVPGIPPALERMVSRLLAKAPFQRYPSADAVRQELKAFLARKSPVPREQGPQPVAPGFRQSAKRLWPVAAGALVVAVAGAGLMRLGRPGHASKAVALLPESHVPPASPPAPRPAAPEARVERPTVEALALALPASLVEEDGAREDSGTVRPALHPGRSGGRKAQSPGPRGRPRGFKTRASRTVSALQAPAESVSFSHELLQTRLAEATVRLRQRDVHAVSSPAMARLMALHRRADEANTEETRVRILSALEEWEMTFLPKR
ncbi:serine/threonine protein kinase [Stigmatella aurantiaca]|uniref:non-specific serine/threonine protein kinase n=1 Tax=Stigmatella aurantiaca TaxID=41 RepID=A0A1H7XLT5_STIAU|nr:serine/threonine protein kinase [Stigmatella aurantiaca]